jgi:uncharacterized protein (DUF849 family)
MSRWPAILSVAPNGARKTRAQHEALPIEPAELAAEARSCRDAGASLLHLHVRDEAGEHSLDMDRYRAAQVAIRAAVGSELILQVTTEAVGRYRPEEQRALVEQLAPEAVSLGLRELLPAGADRDAEAIFARFLAGCAKAGTLVQFILYDADDLRRLADLQARGIVPQGRLAVLFVLGRYTKDMQSDPADLAPFIEAGGSAQLWSVCAFGRREADCAAAALAVGGHVRVGFENNLHLADGSLAPDNAALVRQAAAIARELGRTPCDAATARRLMTTA